MQTLTLNDGSVIENVRCLEVDNKLFLYCSGMDMRTGFDTFIDPGKTERMVWNSSGEEFIYTGYTTLFSINMEYGNCNVVLKKP